MDSYYYKHIETGRYFRVWQKATHEFIVFKRVLKQYFDGLWEMETEEQEIATCSNMDECYTAMIDNA